MRRVAQLQAAKFSGMSGKSIIFLDFPRQAGLDAPELPGEHRLKKRSRSSLGSLEEIRVYLPLGKSDERRFSQAVGRISQCLAAERRQ